MVKAKKNRTGLGDDLAVLGQLLNLTGGQLDNFDPVSPKGFIRRHLAECTLGELQGILVETLAELRKRETTNPPE